MRTLSGAALFATALLLPAADLFASGIPVPIPERARGAERVVVARVVDLQGRFDTNEFGDHLIVTRVKLAVEESLKGQREDALEIDVLGGTAGDLTLDVSTLPRMNRGERAVFFLTRDKRSGTLIPHLRGQGILKLDDGDRVKGSSLDLETIKRLTASSAAR